MSGTCIHGAIIDNCPHNSLQWLLIMRLFMHQVILSFLLVVSISPLIAYGAEDIYGDSIETFGVVSKKTWQEADVKTPDKPLEDSLIRVEVYEMPQYKYYIDEKSLHVSARDNVARYTVVIETPSGVRNVFFEGIRCDKQEYKLYASAINDEPFKKSLSLRWNRIHERGVGAIRHDLFKYYLCSNSIIKDKKRDIIQSLKYPPTDHADDTE